MPRPPALLTAATRSGPVRSGPIGAAMIGCSIPSRWQRFVFMSTSRFTCYPDTVTNQAALVWDLNSHRCLDLGHAAINEQLDAGDVTAVVRGEEHGGVRHLVRRAHPAHRRGSE